MALRKTGDQAKLARTMQLRPTTARCRPHLIPAWPSTGSRITKPAGRPHESDQDQKSQSSSSVFTALPMTYDEPDPEKKSWFSSAFGDRADRIAGFTSVMFFGNIGS